ncbi:hypothetical protein V8E36_009517 [Tilletia maclaganii]
MPRRSTQALRWTKLLLFLLCRVRTAACARCAVRIDCQLMCSQTILYRQQPQPAGPRQTSGAADSLLLSSAVVVRCRSRLARVSAHRHRSPCAHTDLTSSQLRVHSQSLCLCTCD